MMILYDAELMQSQSRSKPFYMPDQHSQNQYGTSNKWPEATDQNQDLKSTQSEHLRQGHVT